MLTVIHSSFTSSYLVAVFQIKTNSASLHTQPIEINLRLQGCWADDCMGDCLEELAVIDTPTVFVMMKKFGRLIIRP